MKRNKASAQSTWCYCKCGNELVGSHSFLEDTDLVRYVCSHCQRLSEWNFDVMPAPYFMRSYFVAGFRPEDV